MKNIVKKFTKLWERKMKNEKFMWKNEGLKVIDILRNEKYCEKLKKNCFKKI